MSRPLPKLIPGAEHDRKSTRLSHERAMAQEMKRQLRNCTSVNVQLEKSTPSKPGERRSPHARLPLRQAGEKDLVPHVLAKIRRDLRKALDLSRSRHDQATLTILVPCTSETPSAAATPSAFSHVIPPPGRMTMRPAARST